MFSFEINLLIVLVIALVPFDSCWSATPWCTDKLDQGLIHFTGTFYSGELDSFKNKITISAVFCIIGLTRFSRTSSVRVMAVFSQLSISFSAYLVSLQVLKSPTFVPAQDILDV